MGRWAGRSPEVTSQTGRLMTNCSIRFGEVSDMARGDKPLPLEQLEPYMRGVKFAVQALSRRHIEHDSDLADDAARYFGMAERYRQGAIATLPGRRGPPAGCPRMIQLGSW